VAFSSKQPTFVKISFHDRCIPKNISAGNYFSEAYNDSISVWEDESIAFDVLANDYVPGGQYTITKSSIVSNTICFLML